MDSRVAEILALKTGLKLAIILNIKYLEINPDSQILIKLLLDPDPLANLLFLINDCRCLLSQLTEFKLLHCWRECNSVADALAKEGNATNAKFTTFISTPSVALQAFHKDLVGTIYTKTLYLIFLLMAERHDQTCLLY